MIRAGMTILVITLVACSARRDRPPEPPPDPVPHPVVPDPGTPDASDIDRNVELAIARQHAALAGPVARADARQREAEAAVASSQLGTAEDRARTVSAMQRSWRDGHSPQAQAIFDGEADAERKLRS